MAERHTSPNPTSYLSTRPFAYEVQGQVIYVYPEVISSLSDALDHMMNGPFEEAQKGIATIQDCSAKCFTTFCDWANVCFFDKRQQSSKPNYDDDGSTTPRPAKRARVERLPLHSAWARITNSLHALSTGMVPLNLQKTSGSSTARVPLETLFLYAELFLLGDKYGIKNLQEVAARELCDCLTRFHLNSNTAPQLLQILDFAEKSDYTVRDESLDLKKITRSYVDWKMSELSQLQVFRKFLRDNPEYFEVFMDLVVAKTQPTRQSIDLLLED